MAYSKVIGHHALAVLGRELVPGAGLYKRIDEEVLSTYLADDSCGTLLAWMTVCAHIKGVSGHGRVG